MATIGEQIIAARRAKSMTQEELADAVGLSRSQISHYECDRKLPDEHTLSMLSQALDCSLEPDGEQTPVPSGDA